MVPGGGGDPAGRHAAVPAEVAPATYRLDYFHTGGQGAELFAVDRLRLEPLPWPGNPTSPADDGPPGVYRYEAHDADGTLLQVRGFASVFGEWVTTEEAQRYGPSTNPCAFRRPPSRGSCRSSSSSAMRSRPSSPCGRCRSTPLTCRRSHGCPVERVDCGRAARCAARQGRPAADRRWLHGGGLCRQVPQRYRADDGSAVQQGAVRASPAGLQRLGPLPARGRVRHFAALDRHPARDAGRRDVRCLRQRTLHPHASTTVRCARSPPARRTKRS